MNYKRIDPVILPKDKFIGHPQAPITLMEFGDYECESALDNDLIVREVLQRFPGLVRFNYRHFPLLKIHQRAHKAAEAAIAAAQVGKFAQMHDLMLRNRRHLGAASLALYAKELGISAINFLDALSGGRYGQYVQDDLVCGMKLGVKEVPSFFVNGEKLKGRITIRNLGEQIEAVCDKVRTAVKPKTTEIHARKVAGVQMM